MIRLGAERAREICAADNPFSSQRCHADGRTIFAEIINGAGELQLLDLVKSQFAFARVIRPSLYAGIEFSDRDMPVPRWPLGRQTPVVIDPARSFGQPIVGEGGIPTVVLADAVAAEDSVANVARLFRLPRARSRRRCGSSSGTPAGLPLEGLYRQQPLAYLAHALNTLLEPEGDQA